MGDFVVIMRGGLGNQLFIFAAAAYLMRKTGMSPVFDFLDARASNANHGNSIEEIVEDLGYKIRRRPRNLRTAQMLVVLKNELERFTFETPTRNRNNFLRSNPGWVGELSEFDASAGPLSGYFQSYKYAEEAGPELEDLWQAIIKRAPIGAVYRDEFARERLTGIHIRRGDYLGSAKNFGAIDFESTLNGESLVSHEERVVVFSDDTGYVESIFGTKKNTLALHTELREASDLDQLVALSGPRRLIISNSSFGWWAAYFSKSSDVLAPFPWFKVSESPLEITPPSWGTYEPTWVQ